MKQTLGMIGLAGTLLVANNVHAQELAKNLGKQSCSLDKTEIQRGIKEALSKYKIYEIERNELFKDLENHKNEFKILIDSTIQQIHEKNAKDTEIQQLLYYMYCDCEFADIQAPEKLKDLLSESKPRIQNDREQLSSN